jgi:hypothetical protein
MQVSWAGTAAALMAACGLAFGVPGVAAGLALGSVAAAVGITAWSSHFLHVSLKRPAATAFGYLSGFAIAAVAVPVLQPWGPFVSSGALLAAAAAMVWVIGRPVATGRQALDAIANSQHV